MKRKFANIVNLTRSDGLQPKSSRHRGFTLVELLVTISIIGIMATFFLGAMYSSAETGRADATKATIAKINNLVMQRYEAYRTRRVPISIITTGPVGAYIAGHFHSTPMMTAVSTQRLDALRELMRMEMPDRWSDVYTAPSTSPPNLFARSYSVDSNGNVTPNLGQPTPSLWSAYNRKYLAIQATNPAYPTDANEGAECLYLICTTGISDELDNQEQFRQNEVKDTDGDGAPEFIDGWGNPISFLRWAPGFYSELQTHKDPDPFDSRHCYPSSMLPASSPQTQATYALYPLVFSWGSDGQPGIISKPDSGAAAMLYSTYNNDPWASFHAPSFSSGPIGTVYDSGLASDNIHNHMMGTK